MGGIFICYRRTDSGPYAGRLRDTLTNRFGADQIFRDLDGIHPGERFAQVIDQALTACDVLLAVIGPTWLSMVGADGTRRLDDPKDYVRREIAAALERDDVVVVPVLIGTTAMPLGVELPAVLAGLTERHGLRLSDENWDDQMAHLVRTLEPVVQRSAPVTAHPAAPPQPTPTPASWSGSARPQPPSPSSSASARRPTASLSVAAVAVIVLAAALGFTAVRAFGGSSSKKGEGSGGGNTTIFRPYGPDTCRIPFVWREARPTDHVCVTSERRQETLTDNNLAASRWVSGAFGAHTCTSGYVWREAYLGDEVCVTPTARSYAAEDNALASTRLESSR